MLRVQIALVLGLTSLAVHAAIAQQPVLVRHYPVRLMDIGVLADTVRGVSIVAAPSLRSAPGTSTRITWLRLHPDSLLQWLDVAPAYTGAAARPGEGDGVRWAPALKALIGAGGMSIGRKIRGGRTTDEAYLIIADSAYSWRLELSPSEADGLLRLLLEAASLSRVAPPLGDAAISAGAVCEKPDTPVYPEHQPAPRATGVRGRVAVQYVVSAAGQPEMKTFVAVLATHGSLTTAAQAAIAKSRFRPAVLQGTPVRQLVQQVIVFR